MSNKLKNNKIINKIKKENSNDEYYIFDFKYLTNNKNYNFDYFKKDIRSREEAYNSLIDKIIEISKNL